MNKINVNVPSDIQYISEWKEYTIPYGHCIIDKGVTGCGFTEYCLTNSENIILCSPRRLLLQNKVDQHQGDSNILYLKNEGEKRLEYDCCKIEKKRKIDEVFVQDVSPLIQQISQHSVNCQIAGLPIKFLVTYDSFKYLYETLGENIKNYKIVIDEFQSLFADSSFKPNTELDLLEYLQDCPNVCYLSATPALDHYLDTLDEFKDLDMYVFLWNQNQIDKVKIIPIRTSSIYNEGRKYIQNYLNGVYPFIVTEDGVTHYSKELVIYLNSIIDIGKLVESCNLTPLNTDIICADTEINRRKLKKLGFTISKPHKKEDRHLNKMFTFCTRTVYLGADFYSDSAYSIILSNPNKRHLALDIATDLPQIVGRQRLRNNLFRQKYEFFYQTTNSVKTFEEFEKVIQDKLDASDEVLQSYDALPEKFMKDAISRKLKVVTTCLCYGDDYVGVSSKTNVPKVNRFVLLSESRFWEITQQDYLDAIQIRRAVEETTDLGIEQSNLQESHKNLIMSYAERINSEPVFGDKIKLYCDCRDQVTPFGKLYVDLLDSLILSPNFSSYYNYFGTKGIKAASYKEINLKRLMSEQELAKGLDPQILQEFQVGSKMTRKEIKDKLKDIYQRNGITGLIPKASDLEKWFEIKAVQIMINSKKEHGFKILSIKNN